MSDMESSSMSKIPISAPINTDSAGTGGPIAIQSVVRIICPEDDSAGTGFLHRSGNIITAEHVVGNSTKIVILPSSGEAIEASIIAKDSDFDLALLSLDSPLSGENLPISKQSNYSTGSQVTTWGFPVGYSGIVPLLSVGYLVGLGEWKAPSGKIILQQLVNAAFNSGNSGGPLLNVETGEVIGVVTSKIAPISNTTQSALDALSNQKQGFMYPATLPDGTKKEFSEGQVIAQVLNYLRSQVQLVIGTATMTEDLRAFLDTSGCDP